MTVALHADEIHRLKSFNTSEKTVYTVAQINTYPLPIYAVQIVTSKSRKLLFRLEMSI